MGKITKENDNSENENTCTQLQLKTTGKSTNHNQTTYDSSLHSVINIANDNYLQPTSHNTEESPEISFSENKTIVVETCDQEDKNGCKKIKIESSSINPKILIDDELQEKNKPKIGLSSNGMWVGFKNRSSEQLPMTIKKKSYKKNSEVKRKSSFHIDENLNSNIKNLDNLLKNLDSPINPNKKKEIEKLKDEIQSKANTQNSIDTYEIVNDVMKDVPGQTFEKYKRNEQKNTQFSLRAKKNCR